ncbi:WSC domain-containing protein, partial [Mycena vulgaris]
CATDTPSRILTNTYITNSDTNTPLSCTQKCFFLGFTYAGVEYCKECYCSASLVSDVSAANIADCDMPCAGDATITCGAGWRVQHHAHTSRQRCTIWLETLRHHHFSPRLREPRLRQRSAGDVLASTNTPAACMSYCAKLGYSMSGVEYGSECYCGNTWTNSAPPADIPASSCNMPCSGAPGTTCGRFWAIQIY